MDIFSGRLEVINLIVLKFLTLNMNILNISNFSHVARYLKLLVLQGQQCDS
jgi:hypothetical protein